MGIKDKLKKLKHKLCDNEDVAIRCISSKGNQEIGIIYLKSMIDTVLLAESILTPIFDCDEVINLENLKNDLLKIHSTVEVESDEEIVNNVLSNSLVIILKSSGKSISVDIEKFPVRVPSEPPTSAVIQGPREGFTEDIKTNISLLRRRFKTDTFKIESLEVGRRSKTKIMICYLHDVADKKVVKKIKERLKKIDIDGIIDASYLIPFLSDRPNSMFKQVGTSEKPDVVAAKVLEGRVAIIVDNSPIVLTLPFVVFEDVQNSNDYYTNCHYVSLMRVIRAIGILVATIVPGVFLSFRLFHYNVLPLKYIITVADAAQGVPFTPVLELIFILVLFQILYEVSLRLPRYLGLATSIVGALILGDTGVKAGLISPPGVVIVAMSIISIYVVPDEVAQLTLLRAIFLVLGGTIGMLGIIGGMIFFINYMNKLDNYGAPYLAPYAPRINSDTKDGIMMVPLTNMTLRPFSFENKNKVRMK